MNIKTLYKITYGMYIVSSKKENRFNGQIANTVFQTTSENPTIAVCVNRSNLTHEFIQESKVFTVSILNKDTPMNFIGNFGFKSGRDIDKFKDIDYKIGKTEVPAVLQNCIGYLEAEVVGSIEVGTHTVFIGKIVNAEITKEGEPMTYAYYHEVKNGLSPKTAPTYVEDNLAKELINKEETGMQKYRCTLCGYIYEPEKGDPDSGIKPGTPFKELSDGWVCPVCGADKSRFEEVND